MCQLGSRICGFFCCYFSSTPVAVTVFCGKMWQQSWEGWVGGWVCVGEGGVGLQCHKTWREQASGSEGEGMITVDTKWLRQKKQKKQYSAWVSGWVWKTFCFSDTFKSAEIHTRARTHALLTLKSLWSIFFPKGGPLKWKCQSPRPLHTRYHHPSTRFFPPFSYNMCFIDQRAVTWIAAVVRLLSCACSSAAASIGSAAGILIFRLNYMQGGIEKQVMNAGINKGMLSSKCLQ